MKNRIRPDAQRGTAIIVALFVTTLVASIAVAMIAHLGIDTRRTELILNDIDANLYAEGSIAFAKDQLINDLKQKQPGKVVDRTPIISPVSTVHRAKILTIIEDAQGKLNLNNLTDANFQPVLTQLIQTVMPNINLMTAKNITRGVVDWITPGLHDSAFDAYYAKLNPPYRAPHRAMASVSELRLIQGVTPELYAKLEPFVTALPDKILININSAPIPLIMSFAPNITLEMAKALDQFRQSSPLTTLDMLANFPAIKNTPLGQSGLTVTSDFFLVKTHVTIGNQENIINTLMMRLLKNSNPVIVILWQAKGTV